MAHDEFNPSYVGPRPDVEAFVPAGALAVLDVGCSNGTVGASIKHRSGACVWGIEMSPEMADEAKHRLDRVFVGDAHGILESGAIGDQRFDAIIFADVLEHVADPWRVLQLATAYLSPEGVVISSIPNIRHIDTLWNLVVRGRWPYRERGIHDRTHLRFFTRKNIVELMDSAGLQIEGIHTNYRIIERPHDLNRHARALARIPGLSAFLAFQYVTQARLRRDSVTPPGS